MIPTSFLYQLAEYEGIGIDWHDFEHIEGLYTYTPTLQSPIISLSSTLQTQNRRLRCVLSHELGHHFMTAGHHMIAASGTSSIYAVKNERLATAWAVNLMLDTYDFLQCVKEGLKQHELEDYFCVLPEFVEVKGELLRESEEHTEVVAELRASYDVVF